MEEKYDTSLERYNFKFWGKFNDKSFDYPSISCKGRVYDGGLKFFFTRFTNFVFEDAHYNFDAGEFANFVLLCNFYYNIHIQIFFQIFVLLLCLGVSSND